VADPRTAPAHETSEEANVRSNFLLTDVTPTAANIVGKKTNEVRKFDRMKPTGTYRSVLYYQ
jgi:hypothetical protein